MTRTFMVERITPGKLTDHGGSIGISLRLALPFEVEVGNPEVRNENYESTCKCQFVYRLTDDAVKWLKRFGLMLKKGNYIHEYSCFPL
jgi:hypothetical protein